MSKGSRLIALGVLVGLVLLGLAYWGYYFCRRKTVQFTIDYDAACKFERKRLPSRRRLPRLGLFVRKAQVLEVEKGYVLEIDNSAGAQLVLLEELDRPGLFLEVDWGRQPEERYKYKEVPLKHRKGRKVYVDAAELKEGTAYALCNWLKNQDFPLAVFVLIRRK